MWQMDFVVQPQVLADIRHQLKVDEGVLRFATLKRRVVPSMKELKNQLKESPPALEQ